jgi:hypothetical protein
MRKHVAWYVRGLYDNSTLCREINHSKNPAETEELLLRYLDKLESMPHPFTPSAESSAAGDGACDAEETVVANGSGTSP